MTVLLPKISNRSKSRDMVEVFGGYNHNLRISEGEFYDMKNMTSTHYPMLSPRKPRSLYKEGVNVSGIIAKEELCYIDGVNFVIGDVPYDMGLSDEPKNLVSMGAYVIIMPDKKYINTVEPEDRGDIEFSVQTTEMVTFSLCKESGEEYEGVTVDDHEPSRTDKALWLDTSVTPNVLKEWSEQSSLWMSIVSYVKLSSSGIGTEFADGDGVSISGIILEGLEYLNKASVIKTRADDYIVIEGVVDRDRYQGAVNAIKIRRLMPNLDFVIESDNRLWGCRYGLSVAGEMVNEIYASKLGDFKSWNSFRGISTDSYVASVGSDGPFTGAVTHLGYPIFFKENTIHKVYGNMPSSYQIQTTSGRGVQKGSERSLAIVNEVLYYKSRSAICAYDGSLPQEVSAELGDKQYYNAVAGAVGNKYYISMMSQEDGKHNLFVYDTRKRMWNREDNEASLAFSSWHGELFYIDADKRIKTILGSIGEKEGRVKWEAETGILGASDPDKKYISRIDVRMSLQADSYVDLYIEYDSSGVWEKAFSMLGDELRSFSVPIRARRCDHLRLKIEGQGEARILSIAKTVEGGSNI